MASMTWDGESVSSASMWSAEVKNTEDDPDSVALGYKGTGFYMNGEGSLKIR